jgi:putative glutamine amidotransferase
MTDNNSARFPIIGISATLLTIESGSFMGRERAVVGQDYIEAIRLAGGIPIVLPIVEGKELMQQQMQLVDALLLSGGYDVHPLFYQEEPARGLEAFRIDRDLYEIQLLQIAKASHKPILGICRGLQLLNVAFGGTLYQDIGLALPSALQHSQKAKPEEATHSVIVVPKTKLHHIMEEEVILANSFHHQAIKDLAPGLVANAYTKDGLIEGIEGKEDLFILAVQWHPELMLSKHPKMFKLFQAFIEVARQRQAA